MAWGKAIKKRKNETELEYLVREMKKILEENIIEITEREAGKNPDNHLKCYSVTDLKTFNEDHLDTIKKMKKAILLGMTTRIELISSDFWN